MNHNLNNTTFSFVILIPNLFYFTEMEDLTKMLDNKELSTLNKQNIPENTTEHGKIFFSIVYIPTQEKLHNSIKIGRSVRYKPNIT